MAKPWRMTDSIYLLISPAVATNRRRAGNVGLDRATRSGVRAGIELETQAGLVARVYVYIRVLEAIWEWLHVFPSSLWPS